jgi:hypothetical protein
MTVLISGISMRSRIRRGGWSFIIYQLSLVISRKCLKWAIKYVGIEGLV